MVLMMAPPPWMTIGGRRQAEGQWKGSMGSDEDSEEKKGSTCEKRGEGVKKGGSGRGRRERAPSGWLAGGWISRRVSWPYCVCLTSVVPGVLLARVRGRTADRPASLSCSYLGARTGGCERSWAYTKEVDATRNNTASAGWS